VAAIGVVIVQVLAAVVVSAAVAVVMAPIGVTVIVMATIGVVVVFRFAAVVLVTIVVGHAHPVFAFQACAARRGRRAHIARQTQAIAATRALSGLVGAARGQEDDAEGCNDDETFHGLLLVMLIGAVCLSTMHARFDGPQNRALGLKACHFQLTGPYV
jgi:hypothetical protein